MKESKHLPVDFIAGRLGFGEKEFTFESKDEFLKILDDNKTSNHRIKRVLWSTKLNISIDILKGWLGKELSIKSSDCEDVCCEFKYNKRKYKVVDGKAFLGYIGKQRHFDALKPVANFLNEHGYVGNSVGFLCREIATEQTGVPYTAEVSRKDPFHFQAKTAYVGGLCALNENLVGVTIREGITLDVNSMYSSILADGELPYSPGMEVKRDKLTVEEILALHDNGHDGVVEFRLTNCCVKPNKLPWYKHIWSPGDNYFCESLMIITTSGQISQSANDTMERMYIDDFVNFLDCYDCEIGDLSYYIYHTKSYADISKAMTVWKYSKHPVEKMLGKMVPNIFIGTEGTASSRRSYIDGKAIESTKDLSRNAIMSAAVCAKARTKLLNAIHANFDRFIYCDTDSIHLIGTEPPNEIEIHQSKLGAWKVEREFTRARYLKAKTYAQVIDGEVAITCAGLGSLVDKQVKFKDFKIGAQFKVKRYVFNTRKKKVELEISTKEILPPTPIGTWASLTTTLE